MEMRRMLGQKLVFGFHGKTLPEEFKNLLREYKIGNVILFLRNVESAEQLRALCAEIQSLVQEETGYPAFIIIDQEGGMVTRLPQDAVNVPGAMALAGYRRPEKCPPGFGDHHPAAAGAGRQLQHGAGAGCQQQSSQSGDRRAQLRRRSGARGVPGLCRHRTLCRKRGAVLRQAFPWPRRHGGGQPIWGFPGWTKWRKRWSSWS